MAERVVMPRVRRLLRTGRRTVATARHEDAHDQGRLFALDVARALAIWGMIAVNVGREVEAGPMGLLVRVASGRASILFVLLAGIGVALLTRHAPRAGPTRWRTLLWRAALLMIGGLSLQMLDHGVNVILPTYAALFVIALVLARVGRPVLLLVAVVAIVGGPLVWIAAQAGAPFTLEPPTVLDPPSRIVSDLLVSGAYPLVTWTGPFVVGMWLGRGPLRDRYFQRRLVVCGLSAAVGAMAVSRILVVAFGEPGNEPAFDRLTSAVAHSQMPLWLISSTGTAAMVVGVLLILVPRHERWWRPLAAVGKLSLTVYVAHLVILATIVRPWPQTAAQGLLITAALIIGATVLAGAWSRLFEQGPLEALLRLPFGRQGKERGRSPGPDDGAKPAGRLSHQQRDPMVVELGHDQRCDPEEPQR